MSRTPIISKMNSLRAAFPHHTNEQLIHLLDKWVELRVAELGAPQETTVTINNPSLPLSSEDKDFIEGVVRTGRVE